MPTPTPVEDPQAWAIVALADMDLPGYATFEGLASEADVDVQKSKGKDKAKFKDNGAKPAEFVINIAFIPAFQAKLEEICAIIHPNKAGGERRPVSIRNARTSFLGINSVYIRKIVPPEYDSKGLGSMSIGVMEYVAEPKETKAKTGGAGGATKSAVERDLWGPGSFIEPLDAPILTETIDPNNEFTPQADKDFLDFMNGTMTDSKDPKDSSFNFDDFKPGPPPST